MRGAKGCLEPTAWQVSRREREVPFPFPPKEISAEGGWGGGRRHGRAGPGGGVMVEKGRVGKALNKGAPS